MTGRQTRARIKRGLLTPDGRELTDAGERAAEYEAECRAGWWDPPAEFDPPSLDAPDPYPGGSTI